MIGVSDIDFNKSALVYGQVNMLWKTRDFIWGIPSEDNKVICLM